MTSPEGRHELSLRSAPVSLQIPAMVLLVFSGMQVLYAAVPLPVLLGVSWIAGAPRSDLLMLAVIWIGAASSVIVLIASLRMRGLKNYRVARFGAILACIPILSPSIYFGIPFGLWALFVLRKPDVRALFST